MKIAIISTSDSVGGAAIAARRLADALIFKGQDVSFVTLSGRSRLPFLAERIEIFVSNGFSRKNLFMVSSASHGVSVASLPQVQDADAIILAWFCQGLLSLRELEKLGKLGKPILWTMHDMWDFTGICHHSLGCLRYENECGHCPFIRPVLRRNNDLSHRVWERKRRIYDAVPINFVAVSRWLADKAKSSLLLRHKPVCVIPNPHPINEFSPVNGRENLIVMGAARLDAPIKGLEHAIAALNLVHDTMPEAKVSFFGKIRNSRTLNRLRMPYTFEGPLDVDALRALYSRASVVLSASDFETSGNTLIEGMASGAVPVSFNQGGQTDIIDHLTNGYLANHPDVEDLARGLRWALKSSIPALTLHNAAESKFGADAVADQYLKLIESINL